MYYSALAIVWCVLWGMTALALGGFPESIRQRVRQRWHPWSIAGVTARIAAHEWLTIAVMTLCFANAYALAYAPAAKFIRDAGTSSAGPPTDFFVPVQWMTDESVLREPLLQWADLWGQRDRFANESDGRHRAHYWGGVPPQVYGAGWVCLSIACVVGPASVIRLAAIRIFYRARPVKSGES